MSAVYINLPIIGSVFVEYKCDAIAASRDSGSLAYNELADLEIWRPLKILQRGYQ